MQGPLSKYPSAGSPMAGFPAGWVQWVDQICRRFEKQVAVTGQGKVVIPSEVTLEIQNVTGGNLAQYSIVAIGAPLVVPGAADESFFGEAVFESDDPSSTAPFAITQDPGLDDDIVKARASGISPCKLEISDTSHEYANATTADYDKLTSQAGVGPARILWINEPASTQLNGAINDSVTEIVVDDGSEYPEAPFVVTIDSEDLEVTQTHAETTLDEPSDIDAVQTSIVVASSAGVPATPFEARIEDEYITVTNVVSVTWTVTRAPGAVAHEDGAEVVVLDYTTWQVTRGENATTPASHADNAAVTFASGTVWALVMLTGAEAGGSVVVESGTYNPVVTAVTNISNAGDYFPTMYTRIGDIVTVMGRLDVQPTIIDYTELAITLPIPSNFADVEDCSGVAFANFVIQGAEIVADTTNNRALMQFQANTTLNCPMSYTFTYRIL